jgi:hypothetical protein
MANPESIFSRWRPGWARYLLKCEITSKPVAEYQTDEYFELDLPAAPAVMVGDDIVAEGTDVDEHQLETVICKHLGLPAPEPPKKSFIGRLFGK